VVLLVVTFIILEPAPVTEVGLKATAAPEGSPLTAKVTIPLNPVPGVTVAV
jgi:hypothetical protein